MGTPAHKPMMVKVSFKVLMTTNKEKIPVIIQKISNELNLSISRIEREDGVKLITEYQLETE